MKRAILGSLVCVGLVGIACGAWDNAGAQQQRPVTGGNSSPMMGSPSSVMPSAGAVTGSDLIVVPSAVTDKYQVLTVIDPKQKVMCIYSVDLATGEIALRSARDMHWDLQIRELNNSKGWPTTHEVESRLQQR
jgi:hypothetical protein